MHLSSNTKFKQFKKGEQKIIQFLLMLDNIKNQLILQSSRSLISKV